MMIEEIVLKHLENELGKIVFIENQTSNISKYVIIGKSGSSRKNHINSATFFIQSYAKTKYEASLLNEKVKEAMDRLVIIDSISSSKLNADYDYTDTTKKKYRYQAVYDIHY